MEQQISDLVAKLVGLSPIAALIIGILGTLVVIAQVVITVTPSKSDDAAWDKIKSIPVLGSVLSILTSFAVIQKK
jgi:hypothetical protein